MQTILRAKNSSNAFGSVTIFRCGDEKKTYFFIFFQVPVTSINLERERGDDIPIEERNAAEMLSVNGTTRTITTLRIGI